MLMEPSEIEEIRGDGGDGGNGINTEERSIGVRTEAAGCVWSRRAQRDMSGEWGPIASNN